MNKNVISCQINDLSEAPGAALFGFANEETVRHVYNFHRSLPGYRPSPLVRLSGLTGYLGIQQLLIKDENHRFDLKAFKVLGASYAMAKDPCIISGESGAVTLGALFEIMTDKENIKIRKDIGLNSDSRVLLFSTEGDTDPDVYRDIVWA